MIENFRDISKFNNFIKKGLIYRSSVYGISQNITFLEKLNIETIIDVRTPFEVENNDYRDYLPPSITHYNLPIDIEQAKTMHQGTPMESAYKFFAINCKNEISSILKVLSNSNGNCLIHCTHGMDRTGIVIALIHLICNTAKDEIIKDYLETGGLTKQTHIDIFFNSISSYKSIEDYIVSDSFTLEELKILQNKLSKDND